MAHDANPLPLEQRADDVGIDRDAAHGLDFRARNRLAVGDQRQGLEQGPRITLRPLRPEPRDRRGVLAPHLNTKARSGFLDLDGALSVLECQRIDRGAHSGR